MHAKAMAELKLSEVSARPFRAGSVTFAVFTMCGLVPLTPFLFGGGSFESMFRISLVLSAATFFALGIGKGAVLGLPPLRSGIQTLVIGSVAAGLAYATGVLLRQMFGIAVS